ncbi:calmodulin [Eurytemora carolleeae]|uniref:calmodulin n=1 Tax=Eurytemora carolleeae TaxID=1294199 RepID=UPI000C76E138|nr:calmodulin [Eurytemora carolleeae]|eukprot:XP_023335694.1 calmodulin-like [Eurytemora affinis]
MTDILNEIQTAEFREAFNEFDKDGSGSISTKELVGVMRSIGQNPTEDEILALVLEADTNGDGTIDFEEFLEMMKKQSSETDQLEDLRHAFQIFDRDKDGFISLVELRRITTTLGQVQLDNLEVEENRFYPDLL